VTRRVAVVGAGFGGLTAALRLAHAGLQVTVYEAQAAPGGKARRLPSVAGPVDAGPTVFTMREVYEEVFAEVGARLEDEVRLIPAEILARHVWPDGSTLDLLPDMAASEAAVAAFAGPAEAHAFRAFTARARLLFERFEGPVMRHPSPTPLGVGRAMVGDAVRLLPAMAPFSTMWGALGRQFRDPRLRQLFARYATYMGGSPMASPGILMLIWWAEAKGVWYVEGGMAALAAALARRAEAAGAVFRYGEPVRRIRVEGGRVRGVVTDEGEHAADAVVFNGDPAALGAGLLGEGVRSVAPELAPAARSLSAWVWTFAGRPEGIDLAHHTVFFSGDYEAEFADLVTQRRAPSDPTVYVCAQDRGVGRAVPSPERLLMIMNAPADGERGDPDAEEVERCTTRVFGRLAASGLRLEAPEPSAATLTTPAGFARLFPGSGGAIYGMAPHGTMATFRRPMPRTRVAGLYLAGGAAHPGPGVAMSGLSGRLAAAAMLADRGST
jgi:1-hydroxycarotenoid 3,4-desaturase